MSASVISSLPPAPLSLPLQRTSPEIPPMRDLKRRRHELVGTFLNRPPDKLRFLAELGEHFPVALHAGPEVKAVLVQVHVETGRGEHCVRVAVSDERLFYFAGIRVVRRPVLPGGG